MDNLTALNLVVGFLSPIIIATINRPTFDARLKIAVMVAVSVVAGFGTAYFSNSFNAEDIVSSIMVVMVSSITAYTGIFKPSGVAPKLELATSPDRKLNTGDMSG